MKAFINKTKARAPLVSSTLYINFPDGAQKRCRVVFMYIRSQSLKKYGRLHMNIYGLSRLLDFEHWLDKRMKIGSNAKRITLSNRSDKFLSLCRTRMFIRMDEIHYVRKLGP